MALPAGVDHYGLGLLRHWETQSKIWFSHMFTHPFRLQIIKHFKEFVTLFWLKI